MYSEVEDAIHENLEEALLIGVGTESTWATPSLHSFAGVGINTHNYGVYAVYGGNNYSEVYASESSMKNIPLVVVTSREAAANQKYSFFFDWDNDSENTGTVTITDLRPKAPLTAPHTITLTKEGEYAFELGEEDAFVAGSNCVIADRFVINYEAAKLDGLFGWGNYIDLIPQGNGTCKATVNFAHEGYYNFKVVEGANWYGNDTKIKRDYLSEANIVNNENITLWVDAKGDYTFTWNYASNTITLEYPALPTVQMKGSWDSWADFVDFTPAADGLTASANLHLDPADWYQFKVALNGTDWRSFEYVDDATSPFTRTNNEHNWINADHTDNMTINADQAGDYTFTWTYVENKLTITFPVVAVTSVTTNDYGWATFSYGQDLVPVNATAQTLYKGAINGEYLDLDEVDYVKAGEGVLVYGTPNTIYNFAAGSGSASFTGNALKATATYETSMQNVYVLKGNAFLEYVGTNALAANKAYIKLPGGQNNSPARISMRFNEPQGVENAEAESVKAEKFVENGQVYIRRGNEVYNLQGQIVK